MPLANNMLVQNGSDWVVGVQPSKSGLDGTPGLPNPYGAGASAFEPNTQLLDPTNDPIFAGSDLQVDGQSPQDKAAADALKAKPASVVNTQAPGTPAVSGSALAFINAAKSLLGKPYVWGGTTSSGVDCSGLLYYAFNQAGIKMPRYVASQYGQMGTQVSGADARAGDIVYWNEPGSVDHVGIYLGNGMVLNAPHTGTNVQINQVWGTPEYRRIINDGQFGTMATPVSTDTVTSYAGRPANDLFLGLAGTPIVGYTPPLVNNAPGVHRGGLI